MELKALGWDDVFEKAFKDYAKQGLLPARVICELRHAYALNTGTEELVGACRGRLLHDAASRAALPAVGDWVAARRRSGTEDRLEILAVLPRRTQLSRRAAGLEGHEQVLAANADTLLIIAALDTKLNLRRLERFLAVARNSGAESVIVLNKADLHPDPAEAVAQVEAITGGAPVLAVSAETGKGCAKLAIWLKRGRTIALIGPSGSGKSTLVNRIVRDEVQGTQEVRAGDAKGRHTTTRRELFPTPSGALLIDTPGLRELQLWGSELGANFPDILDLSSRCHFGNCGHQSEEGCAIAEALKTGALDPARWESYLKLSAEQADINAHLASRPDRKRRIVWKKSPQTLRPRFTPHGDHE